MEIEIDTRNVRDEFKNRSTEEIRAILSESRLPFSLLMQNDVKDISRGLMVRILNNFSGQRCIVYGDKRRYDRRACVGTYIYENFDYAKTTTELSSVLRPNSKLIAIELTDNAQSIYDYKFDFERENILMMGHESTDGLDPELREIAEETIYIPMMGSCRSLNVTSAFSIMCYEFSRQYRLATGG